MADPSSLSAPDGVVAAADAQRFAADAGISIEQLMSLLLPRAAEYARPPISNFRVGVVSRGTTTGNLYFGANMEFAGEALSFTVHAEQSSVTNAWMSGEEGIDLLATSAAPCGYCRQFLNELSGAESLRVILGADVQPLTYFLPSAFGPTDLGIGNALMQPSNQGLSIDEDDDVARAALAAANASYAPYSKSYAGVALRTNSGRIVAGAYAENAAFNPSMSPLQVALSRLNLEGESFEAIDDAVLVHVDSLHTEATRVVLRAVSAVPLREVRAE